MIQIKFYAAELFLTSELHLMEHIHTNWNIYTQSLEMKCSRTKPNQSVKL